MARNARRNALFDVVLETRGLRRLDGGTYVDGRAHTKRLGVYPKMTVKEARARAREYWQNPQKFEGQAATGSFKEIAESWIKRYVQANALRSQQQIERMLNRYVYPKWKDRPFLEIRRREANDLLDQLADQHGRAQADAVLAVIRGIMTWHQSRDENYVSPIVQGMRRNKNKKARDRILDDTEIKAVWTACGEMSTFGNLLKIAFLTAQRREKIATMKWEDLSEEGLWTIAAEAREKGTAGRISLPALAIATIRTQPIISGNPYVFAGRGTGPFNSWSQRKDELDFKLVDMPNWVIHDIRRTARSLMSRAGVRPDIAERVLGHAIRGVEGVYDRHHYDEQKAAALNSLANLTEKIVGSANSKVVAISRGMALK